MGHDWAEVFCPAGPDNQLAATGWMPDPINNTKHLSRCQLPHPHYYYYTEYPWVSVTLWLCDSVSIKNLSKLAPFAVGPWNLPHKFHLYLIKFLLITSYTKALKNLSAIWQSIGKYRKEWLLIVNYWLWMVSKNK